MCIETPPEINIITWVKIKIYVLFLLSKLLVFSELLDIIYIYILL